MALKASDLEVREADVEGTPRAAEAALLVVVAVPRPPTREERRPAHAVNPLVPVLREWRTSSRPRRQFHRVFQGVLGVPFLVGRCIGGCVTSCLLNWRIAISASQEKSFYVVFSCCGILYS